MLLSDGTSDYVCGLGATPIEQVDLTSGRVLVRDALYDCSPIPHSVTVTVTEKPCTCLGFLEALATASGDMPWYDRAIAGTSAQSARDRRCRFVPRVTCDTGFSRAVRGNPLSTG